MRTNESEIWKNNKNNEVQPKLSGSYKKAYFAKETNPTKMFYTSPKKQPLEYV